MWQEREIKEEKNRKKKWITGNTSGFIFDIFSNV